MVKAIRMGVPDSYTNAIASSGEHIPGTYNEWKQRIFVMYEERQKKWVFDQTIGTSRSANPQKGYGNTATSTSQKAGGATRRWHLVKMTTFRGKGEPMDISKLHSEGRCFRCHEKGHLGKDCPKKREFQDIRSVKVAEQEQTESKVEEIKEMAV
ncbi:uncharacterized protein ARMOST_21780 [Armillaria ostoyae]|uniref:CCHC-type domain-containing protein n=1 Tax=Armillaria ostoyae TaxID=47428 RepID=A0A284SB17_ARMOS|nr:uncharacterized protein ARMOST_21780 [Armillaria ostoyae]